MKCWGGGGVGEISGNHMNCGVTCDTIKTRFVFVAKDFVQRRFITQICANHGLYLRDNILTITRNMPSNFEPKQLKSKLDYCKKTLFKSSALTDRF